jgi:uncharacterized protein (DUF2235 family)
MKRIIICSDGTWNSPEKLNVKSYPTNVLKFARGISTKGDNDIKQVVFYDWGIGTYHDSAQGGGFGKGLEKNVMDGYRFIIHNYERGDEIHLFGFSRGAYTVRSLCGLLNNCNILKKENSSLVEEAFALYKNPKYSPNGTYSNEWKLTNSIPNSAQVTFIGVWDTVGAMGLPFSLFGLIGDKHLFYDNKLGSNIKTARHALSLDEKRKDFEPTIWNPREGTDLKQVWFAGCHSDVGGSYPPDKDKTFLSDIPMMWLLKEANEKGLKFEKFVEVRSLNPTSKMHNEYKRTFKLLGKYVREIPNYNNIPTQVHKSVKDRYDSSTYKSIAIDNYLKLNDGQWPEIEE